MKHYIATEFSYSKAIKFSLNSLWKYKRLFIKLLGIQILLNSSIYFLTFFLPIPSATLSLSFMQQHPVLLVITTLLAILINLMLVAFNIYYYSGYINICLKIYDNQEVKIKDIFLSKKLVVRYYLGSGYYHILVIIGLLLLIIPGFIFLLNYFFFDLFIVDKAMTLRQGFSASRKLAYGSRWRLLGFVLVMAIVYPLFILMTLGLGLLFALPFGILTRVYVYRQLLQQQQQKIINTPVYNFEQY